MPMLALHGMSSLKRLSVIINNGIACKLCHMLQENGMQWHSCTSLTPHTHRDRPGGQRHAASDSREREGERQRERKGGGGLFNK